MKQKLASQWIRNESAAWVHARNRKAANCGGLSRAINYASNFIVASVPADAISIPIAGEIRVVPSQYRWILGTGTGQCRIVLRRRDHRPHGDPLFRRGHRGRSDAQRDNKSNCDFGEHCLIPFQLLITATNGT